MDALANRNNNASPIERLPGRNETVDGMIKSLGVEVGTRADGTE